MSVNIFLKINFNLVLNKKKYIYTHNKNYDSINATKSLCTKAFKADIKCNDRNNHILIFSSTPRELIIYPSLYRSSYLIVNKTRNKSV